MAEEEEDDESFGDFKFASFPNPTSTSNWGADFVNGPSSSEKPFHPFAVPPSDPAVPAKKPQGAIPLSIFGEEEVDEEEEEEEEAAPANVFFSNQTNGGGSARNGSDSNGSVGISDLISNLYNGSASASSNGAAPGSNSGGNARDLNPDSEDEEDGWEFKSAEWETGTNTQAEATKHDNGALGVGDSSIGISDKDNGGWHLGFEFSPSSASQGHISPLPSSKSESKDTATGLTMFDQSFGNFEDVHSWPGSKQTPEAPKRADTFPTSTEVLKYDGGASHTTIDLSHASETHQSDEWGFGFSFNSSSLGKGSHISESYFTDKSNHDDNNKSIVSPTNINVDSDVNLFESKDAFTEKETKHEKPLISSENHREALPLSIFGDETPDSNELSISQDLSTYAPKSPMANSFNSPGSNLSINDMIWKLYNQTENQTPDVTPKASENQIHAFPDGDDFDDDFDDFKDALPGTGFSQESAQITSFNHVPQVNENGLQSSLTDLNSDLVNGNDDFEDDSWEFKDAFSGTISQDQASTIDHRDLLMQSSTELEPTDCVEFYSKMKDELGNHVLFHLQNLKKAQNVAVLSGEPKAGALEEEIQEYSNILHQDNMNIPNEYLSENYSPRNVNFTELLEVLKKPKFLPLESEYQLASRLSMAEKDMKPAIELLKDTASTLRILKLGSREEHSNYFTIWSKIAFVCSQELKHGAYIWKQAVQKNVHDQILSNPTGVKYILALGEIYRVAEVIGASAKLHKPWMLSGSMDPTSLFALLNECYNLWSASGLEEALLCMSNQNSFESDVISKKLVESIKYIHEFDDHALQSYVISGEETTCQISALPAGFIPGLNLVTWNGKQYFIKLINLWVNLISSDPPKS